MKRLTKPFPIFWLSVSPSHNFRCTLRIFTLHGDDLNYFFDLRLWKFKGNMKKHFWSCLRYALFSKHFLLMNLQYVLLAWWTYLLFSFGLFLPIGIVSHTLGGYLLWATGVNFRFTFDFKSIENCTNEDTLCRPKWRWSLVGLGKTCRWIRENFSWICFGRFAVKTAIDVQQMLWVWLVNNFFLLLKYFSTIFLL